MSRRVEENAALVVRRIDPSWDAARTETSLGGMQRRARRRKVVRAGAAALAVSAIALAVTASLGRPADVARRAEVPPAERSPRVTELGDGSRLVTDDDGRIVVSEVSPTLVEVTLEQGGVDADVARRPDREFVVEAGPVRVVVLGTRFVVRRLAGDRVEVRVVRGRVRVEWDGGDRELAAGERGTFPEAAPPEPEPAADTPAPRARRPRAHARDWRTSARQGEYDDAFAQIEREGAGTVRDQVDDLLLAADAARLSGHPVAALPYLERVSQAHASDPRATMAEFTRGRVLLGLGRAGNAAAAFERAIELGAEGSLHENALARAVEAHGRSGNVTRARALAERYVERYPHGRWMSSVRAYAGLDE